MNNQQQHDEVVSQGNKESSLSSEDAPVVATAAESSEEESVTKRNDLMEKDKYMNPATVFYIRLNQPRSNLLHKMSVPELCRNFSAVAWCGKLNAIACASETCARIPSSNVIPAFWIPIHIIIPERPTECVVFNVTADSPRDSVQFIEWSPTSCPRALLIANFHGRINIWTQPSQGQANVVRDVSSWHLEREWRQNISVVTKWISGLSPYRWLSLKSSTSQNPKSTFEEQFLSEQCQTSGSLQLSWSQWPPDKSNVKPNWFHTSKGLLGGGPTGILAADAIVTDSGALHVAGVPIVNPSTIVVWEVTPGLGNGFQVTPEISVTNGLPPSLNPPNWTGIAPLAAYLLIWQEHLISEAKKGKKQSNQDLSEIISLHCSPVSNFSAYVSPDAAAQSSTMTTWGSGVTAVAFDPTRGGSVISVVIVEGQYMSPYDPDEGSSITGWRVQRWESSCQPVVLHQIFGNPSSNFGGQAPMQTVWLSKVDLSISQTNDVRNCQQTPPGPTSDVRMALDPGIEKAERVSFDPIDLPNDIRALARIVYSAHGREIAIAFLRGGVYIFSGTNFAPVYNYQINVGPAIAAPAFSSTSCCSASVFHDNSKDCTILKIIRIIPPAIPASPVKANSLIWERAIAERFWWSLLVGVDWWDAVGCTQSAAEDGLVSLDSVIAVLDADFHSLPSAQHRQQYGPSLDRIKCRLLEGTNAQEVRAIVLDMQARLLLDMLNKGIESALINPSALLFEPWQVSSETLSRIDPESVAIEPNLVPSIQAYVDTILDLASHFITRLRRYASFCRTLASHTVPAGTGSNWSTTTSTTQSLASPATSQTSQSGTSSFTRSMQMQSLGQVAIPKISSTDGLSSSTTNPISNTTSFVPISINSGTFPGTPALPGVIAGTRINNDANMQKCQSGASVKLEETNVVTLKPMSEKFRSDEGQPSQGGQLVPAAKGVEERPTGRLRLGAGNAGQGYTLEEVRVLFLILVDLCRRTAPLAHPLPISQVGSSNIQVRLHYIDGNYTVLPEIVEASLSPHMQNMPRPRGADAAGLLLRELELHPPSDEWHKQNMFGGPWSDPEGIDAADDTPKLSSLMETLVNYDVYHGVRSLWPRKRRISERDAAFGFNTSVGLGAYLGVVGSRRDVVTSVWKSGLEGVWYKCIRCMRQTSAFGAHGDSNSPNQNDREMWWISRWVYGCPMCGGTWVRVV